MTEFSIDAILQLAKENTAASRGGGQAWINDSCFKSVILGARRISYIDDSVPRAQMVFSKTFDIESMVLIELLILQTRFKKTVQICIAIGEET